MEFITLSGAAVVVFGLWVEFEPVLKRFVNAVSRIRARSSVKPLFQGHRSGLV